jgi:hypothetical protein
LFSSSFFNDLFRWKRFKYSQPFSKNWRIILCALLRYKSFVSGGIPPAQFVQNSTIVLYEFPLFEHIEENRSLGQNFLFQDLSRKSSNILVNWNLKRKFAHIIYIAQTTCNLLFYNQVILFAKLYGLCMTRIFKIKYQYFTRNVEPVINMNCYEITRESRIRMICIWRRELGKFYETAYDLYLYNISAKNIVAQNSDHVIRLPLTISRI